MRSISLVLILALLGSPAAGNAGDSSVLDEIRDLIEEDHFSEAADRARIHLAEVESEIGPRSLEAAEVLDLLVEARYRRTEFDAETIELANRAVSIKEELLGPEDPRVAYSLTWLADVLLERESFAEAVDVLERALRIYDSSPDSDPRGLARALGTLANIHSDNGEYETANSLFERQIAVLEATPDPDPEPLARLRYSLARQQRRTGDYRGAQANYERALEISREKLGAHTLRVGYCLNGLGNVYEEIGAYAEAKAKYDEAMRLLEADPNYGPEHPFAATLLNNLGYLLSNMGDYTAAAENYERSLALSKSAEGLRHSSTAGTLSNLGVVRRHLGHYDEARALLEEALSIREEVFGLEHDEVMTSLYLLGDLELETGHPESAILLFRRSLSISTQRDKPEHPTHAGRSELGLARAYAAMGDLVTARNYFEQGILRQETALGAAHPTLAEPLNDYALLLARVSETKGALATAMRAEEVSRDHIRLTARVLPERQALKYAANGKMGLDLALSLALEESKPAEEVWDVVVRSRALILDEMAARSRIFSTAQNQEVARLVRELARASGELATLTIHGPGEDPGAYRNQLQAARASHERASAVLAERSLAFRSSRSRDAVGFTEVSAHLPSNSALVAFVLYDQWSPSEIPNANWSSVPSYLALYNGNGKVGMVPLGSVREIDELVANWAREVGPGILAKGTWTEKAEESYQTAGIRLRERIWDPIVSELGTPELLFIVPDGSLSLVNLYTFPVSETEFLLETGPTIQVISAERDLVPQERIQSSSNQLLAVGGADFDLLSSADLAAASEASIPGDSWFRSGSISCEGFKDVRFEPLPASGEEAEAISSVWSAAGGGVIALKGPRASEHAVKTRAPGSQVLHLATHGFFLGGACSNQYATTRGIGGMSAKRKTGYELLENPLLLSGLALAGANQRNDSKYGEEDGILTAAEIAAMNLSGVEWAVLSACETGLGRIEEGEGVLGLRRAFQIAGARTVIMSLWAVEDRTTRDWMTALYKARVEKGLDSANCVREASLHILNNRRESGLSSHPYYWAGFIGAGDWN